MEHHNALGVNIEKGSSAEKIWWGLILILTCPLTLGIGLLIGVPMLLIGLLDGLAGQPPKVQTDPELAALKTVISAGVAEEQKWNTERRQYATPAWNNW